jgi:hypothetical protein
VGGMGNRSSSMGAVGAVTTARTTHSVTVRTCACRTRARERERAEGETHWWAKREGEAG